MLFGTRSERLEWSFPLMGPHCAFSLPTIEEKDPGLSPPLRTPSEQEVLRPLASLTFLFGCLLSFSNHIGGLKRKGAPKRKELQKKWKVNEPEVPSEDLLVAMALSRSEMERNAVPSVLRLESAFSERIRLGAGRCGPRLCYHQGSGCVAALSLTLCFCLPSEKKSRKRKAPVCPPPLLVQDLETRGRQTEDRVAQLFAEEMELSSTPPLPTSRILKEEREKAGRHLQSPGGKQNFLWEGSALTGAWVLEDFYTASLVPPMVPQQPTKVGPPV